MALRAASALGALSLAAVAGCSNSTEITVDGLPVTNAETYIRQVDGLWQSHLGSQSVRPSTDPDSRCFFLVYDNVALNSIVCGPVFWLGDLETTWDYYPLETVLSGDGRTLQAVARGTFMRDYPMSEADDLFRFDDASPDLSAALEEPAAPQAEGPVVHGLGFPEARRVTSEFTFPEPVAFRTDPRDETAIATADPADPTQCVTVTRAIWSSHAGQGADVIAAPEGRQFLTLDSVPECPESPYPMITNVDPAAAILASTQLSIDGREVAAPGWDGTGSYLVPAGEPAGATVNSTLHGVPVSLDLLTGGADTLTAAFADGPRTGLVMPGRSTEEAIEERWDLTATATGAEFTDPEEYPGQAILSPYLPQFGPAPDGEEWLVVGISASYALMDGEENLAVTRGGVQLSAAITGSGRMVRLVEQVGPSPEPGSRWVTAITTVPAGAESAELVLTAQLSGWTAAGEETIAIPTVTTSTPVQLTF